MAAELVLYLGAASGLGAAASSIIKLGLDSRKPTLEPGPSREELLELIKRTRSQGVVHDTSDGLPLRPYNPLRPWECNELSEFSAVRLLQQKAERVSPKITVSAPPAQPQVQPHWNQEEASKGLRHNPPWLSAFRTQIPHEEPEIQTSGDTRGRYLWASTSELKDLLPVWIDPATMDRARVINELDLYQIEVPKPTLEQIGFTELPKTQVVDSEKVKRAEQRIKAALQAMQRGDLHMDDARRLIQQIEGEISEGP